MSPCYCVNESLTNRLAVAYEVPLMLQASFNALKTLPAAMGHLPQLELMRVAVNAIEQVGIQLLPFMVA